jgi:hypothetical protein
MRSRLPRGAVAAVAVLLVTVHTRESRAIEDAPPAPPPVGPLSAPTSEATAVPPAVTSVPFVPPPMPRAPLLPADTSSAPTPGFGANLGVGFAFLPTPPDMTLTTPDGGAMKQFASTPVRHVATMDMIAISGSVLYRTGSAIVLPLLGFELGLPITTGYPTTVALGTKAAPLPWIRGGPTYYDGLDILGLGVEFSSGTFRFGLDVLPGFRYVRTTGTITQGVLTVDAEGQEFSFALRAELTACVGARGAFSACLYGAPHVFEFSNWMNGAVFGIRAATN